MIHLSESIPALLPECDDLICNRHLIGKSIASRSENIVQQIMEGRLQREILDTTKSFASQDRFLCHPRAVNLSTAVACILARHEHMYSPATLQTKATAIQVSRVIADLGRQYSGEAACAAFAWFQQRSVNLAPYSWQQSCIAACIHNGNLASAESMYASLLDSGHLPTLGLLNILIVGCCNQGKVEKALQYFDQLEEHDLVPNTTTYMAVMEACNFKGQANCRTALAVYTSFLKRVGLTAHHTTSNILQRHLLQTVQAAIKSAPTVQDAMKCFVGLQHLGLERQTCVLNRLLQRVAQDKHWEKVLQVFRHMLDTGVSLDTDTYNTLIGACIRGGRVSEGFQVFEWMVAGCGNSETIPQTPETLSLLFQGCHQAGALEKALEVLSWMQMSHVKPSPEMYNLLQDTIDIVQLWDRNVVESDTAIKDTSRSNAEKSPTALSHLHGAIMPESLRPAPFDGRRASYASRQPEQTEA